ncbi:hypothetical protein RB195_008456 [Necator americanus]|uniref:Uncharacterized protein n=1 Tax=Necator americanus TaxID=51031 RepID=A0ABR1CNT2_NECAM
MQTRRSEIDVGVSRLRTRPTKLQYMRGTGKSTYCQYMVSDVDPATDTSTEDLANGDAGHRPISLPLELELEFETTAICPVKSLL